MAKSDILQKEMHITRTHGTFNVEFIIKGTLTLELNYHILTQITEQGGRSYKPVPLKIRCVQIFFDIYQHKNGNMYHGLFYWSSI